MRGDEAFDMFGFVGLAHASWRKDQPWDGGRGKISF
jgi:hypothetical protein